MRTFLRGKITLLFMMFGLLIAFPAVAFATDQVIADVDLVTADAQGSTSFTVTSGASFQKTVQFYLDCGGRTHLDPGATNNITFSSAQSTKPAGGSLSAGNASITAPSSWPIDGTNCGTTADYLGTNTSTVSMTAPSVTSTQTYTYKALWNNDNADIGGNTAAEFTVTVVPDGDGDGVADSTDNCPGVVNSNQLDTDGDGTGDACDPTPNGDTPPANVNPTAEANGAYNVNEGGSVTLSSTGSTDSDGSIASYAWDLDNDGQYDDSTSASPSFSAANLDGPSSHTVGLQVTDDDGGTGTDEATVNVINVAPTATFEYPSAAVNEGSSFALELTNPTDPAGTNDTLSYAFDCGDGSFVADSDGVASCSTTDDGTRNVRGKIMDEDGGSTVYPLSGTATVTIDNVRPNVTSPVTQNASEGTAKSFNLGSFADPGDDGAWTATVDWGDGSSSESLGSFNSPGSLGSKSHTYADEGTGSYTVTVTVTEAGSNAPSGSNTFTATVTNALPSVNTPSLTDPNGGVSCLGGNTVNLSSSFSDAGSLDTHSATIDWGDGSAKSVVSDPATSPVTGQHTYNGFGPYTITVTVTDNDGGSSSRDNSTNPLSFHYNIGNTLLSPVNADSSSIFKLGSTIPLKVNITDCNGAGVAGLSPTIKMIKTSSTTPLTGVDEGISTQPNDSNFVMRGDGYGQYIYNLASKSLPDSSATYKAQITDHGYTVTTLNYFGLKAK